jgi:translation initiation factor IF-1
LKPIVLQAHTRLKILLNNNMELRNHINLVEASTRPAMEFSPYDLTRGRITRRR